MRSRIFRSCVLVALVTLLACGGICVGVLYNRTGRPPLRELLLAVAPWLALIAVGVLGLSVLLSRQLTRSIVRPFHALEREDGRLPDSYDELAPLVGRLRRQNQLIRQQMQDLRRQQDEFRTITDNMAEGFILVGNRQDILSYNASALRLLGVSTAVQGDSVLVLNRSEPFRAALEQALAGEHAERLLHRGARDYQILANPVRSEGAISGAVIVIMDVTEKEQREALRREFASNVSHELKTPLTTISGASELLMNGLVRPEDVPRFAGEIHDECARLIALVGDILRISRLDEAPAPLERERLDLWDKVQEAAVELRDAAARRHVTITLHGGPTPVDGIPTVLYEMVYNLMDNAVKYNRDGGSVTVTVGAEGGRPTLTVADTGIGIAPEDQERVFERFYRVDKARSRQNGGTGLGLSIVKHGAAHHGAEVGLTSRVGEGTTITLRFPAPADAPGSKAEHQTEEGENS